MGNIKTLKAFWINCTECLKKEEIPETETNKGQALCKECKAKRELQKNHLSLPGYWYREKNDQEATRKIAKGK